VIRRPHRVLRRGFAQAFPWLVRRRAEPFVRDVYRIVLCREGTDEEIDAPRPFPGAADEQAVIGAMIASAEFRALYCAFQNDRGPGDPKAAEAALAKAGPDRLFVERLYRWLLGRPGDEAGLSHYAAALANGDSRLSVLASIVRSPEFEQHYARIARFVPRDVQLCELANPAKWDNPEWMAILRDLYVVPDDKPRMHRKGYEFTQLLFGLRRLGQIRDDAAIISVGAGHEAVLYWLANHVERVVATDMYEDHWAAGSSRAGEGDAQVLRRPDSYAPFSYRKERLVFMKMDGRRLAFRDATFDAAYSLSSIEHFGGFDGAAAAVDDMIRVVKPGGIVAIATEYRLAGPRHAEVFDPDQIRALCNRPGIRLVGALDERVYSRYDYVPIDLFTNPFGTPHMVVKIGDTVFTSAFFFLEKT